MSGSPVYSDNRVLYVNNFIPYAPPPAPYPLHQGVPPYHLYPGGALPHMVLYPPQSPSLQNGNAWQNRVQAVRAVIIQGAMQEQRKRLDEIERLWVNLEVLNIEIIRLEEQKKSDFNKLSSSYFSSSNSSIGRDIFYYEKKKKAILVNKRAIKICQLQKAHIREKLDRLLMIEGNKKSFTPQDEDRYADALQTLFERKQQIKSSLGIINEERRKYRKDPQKASTKEEMVLLDRIFVCESAEKELQIWKEVDACWDQMMHIKQRRALGLPLALTPPPSDEKEDG